MTTGELDPLIHVPTRLRIVATLATLPDDGALSLTRLQDMTRLTPSSLLAHLRELENARYTLRDRSGSGAGALTTVALTHDGRGALERYTSVLRRSTPTPRPCATCSAACKWPGRPRDGRTSPPTPHP